MRKSVKNQLNARISAGPSVHPKLRLSYRCLTGYLTVGNGKSVSFASALERDWLTVLDFDPSVTNIQAQPFSLYYEHEGRTRRYTPDYYADLVTPRERFRGLVYEVKPGAELHDRWAEYRPRFLAAVRHCRANNLMFKIVTEDEIRTPYWENACFLRHFRDRTEVPDTCAKLIYTLRALGESTPQELLEAAFLVPELRRNALPMLWKLIATRQIVTEFRTVLTNFSHIWLPEQAS